MKRNIIIGGSAAEKPPEIEEFVPSDAEQQPEEETLRPTPSEQPQQVVKRNFLLLAAVLAFTIDAVAAGETPVDDLLELQAAK